MKKLVTFLVISAFVLPLSLQAVRAEDGYGNSMPIPVLPPSGASSTASQMQAYEQKIKQLREQYQGQIQNLRENAQNQIEGLRQAAQKEIEDAKQNIEQTRERFQQAFEVKRAELQNQIETEKSQLKDRLVKIKDARKQQVVQNIGDQINNLNKRMLDHFSQVLDKLAEILTRISSRADKAASRGLNVSAVSSTIVTAQKAIAAARTAITTQAGKVYSVLNATTTDATFKNDVGQVRQMLGNDLNVVRGAVQAARDAVHNAATTLAQIQGVDEDNAPEATSTGTRTPGRNQ